MPRVVVEYSLIDTNIPEYSLNLTNGSRYLCQVLVFPNDVVFESDQMCFRTWIDQKGIEQRIQGEQAIGEVTMG